MKTSRVKMRRVKSNLLRHPQLLPIDGVLSYKQGLGTRSLRLYLSSSFGNFLLLTLVNKWINQPRPYETWEIIPLLDKDSLGNSMPSRHVFFGNHHFHGLLACKSACRVGFVGLISFLGACSSLGWRSLSQGCF